MHLVNKQKNYTTKCLGQFTKFNEPNTNYDLMKLINSSSDCEVIKMKPFQNELQPIKLKN